VAEQPELRLALAMRGGVSLAVWMGGACSETNALRDPASLEGAYDTQVPRRWLRRARVNTADASRARHAKLIDELLAASGYSRVAVDVIAGASAGGLNGALLACSIVHGMPFGPGIRDLWLELGDIAKLARRRSLQPPSVLDGDGRFYVPLRDAMQSLVQRAREGHVPARLDLTLTATLYDPRPTVRYQDLGSTIQESRHRVRFRFRHLAPPPTKPPSGIDEVTLSDLGTSGGGRDDALARLAYAARSTSSFPGAFEPASIRYAPPTSSDQLSHCGVYSETRDREDHSEHDYVIDGGVLDNIPVAWALRSIAAAPADHSVDRWLVYLQPLPFEPVASEGVRRRPDMRATVKQARRMRSGTETLTDDLDELARLQQSRLNQEGYRQIVEYALGEQQKGESDAAFLGALFKRALAAAPAYRDRLGIVEASRARQLWTDPLPVLGADPLGYRSLEWVNKPREGLRSLIGALAAEPKLRDAVCTEGVARSACAAAQQDADLAARTSALIALGSSIRTPQALARTVGALLDSARQLGAEGLAVKGQLYDLRTRIELIIACHDRHLAAEALKAENSDPNEVARRAAWRLTTDGFDLSDSNSPPSGWPQDAYATCWADLVTCAASLAAIAGEPSAQGPDGQPGQDAEGCGEGRTGSRAVLACLTSAASAGVNELPTMHAVLVAVEVLTGPSRPDPLAETSAIRFHMLSAENTSPLPLLQGKDGPLPVGRKLAGNQVANFGAFLRARWRLNDWTWGRLDAARSLVDVLTAPDPVGVAPGGGRTVDWAALRQLAGVKPTTSEAATRDALVAAWQKEILRQELPLFKRLGGSPPSARARARESLRGELNDKQVKPLLRTGRQTVAGLVARDPLRMRIAVRLANVGALGWSTGALRAGGRWVGNRIRPGDG
jgi:patatin-related protein